MKRIFFAILVGITAGFVIGGLLNLIDPRLAAEISDQSKNVYLDSSFILLVLAIILFREALLERREITALNIQNHQTENNLHEQQNRFETIFEHTATGIALLNLDGKPFRVNISICELLGYSEADMLGMNYYYLIPQGDVNKIQEHIQELINRKIDKYQSEHECVRKTGESLWIKSTLSLIRGSHDRPLYLILQVQNISLQKKAEERLRHMAYHDPLTGLANRNKLEQFINQLLAYTRRHHSSFALIYLDLDRFKTINDTIGHDAGDILLQIVGERLRRAVRATDMVARLGGDEFVIVITDVKEAESVANIAEKILHNVLEAIVIQGQEIYITTSIGISLFPYDGMNLSTLMKNADLAMYRAKDHGRNNYQFYTEEMTSKAREKLKLQSALGHALVKNEFLLNYQPKMNIKTRRITGIEALLRWKTKDYSMVTPDEIISLAEETGLIIPVSEWILKTACKQLKALHDIGYTSLTMAINCSPRQFKQASFVEDLLAVITEIGLPPTALEIEVTESVIMHDPENTLRMLYALKDIGAKIAIDDFGTGYWSLNNLRRLSVDKIKIDKTFIKQIAVDETSAAITSAIIAMVNRLGIISIAEGVETREQFEFLSREGCAEIQGYYLSRALPAENLTLFLQQPVPDAEAAAKTEFV